MPQTGLLLTALVTAGLTLRSSKTGRYNGTSSLTGEHLSAQPHEEHAVNQGKPGIQWR